MTVTAMPDAAHGCGWRHRVVAIGSGLGGLTAAKALKYDPVNITDALVFLTRVTAQGTAHLHNRASLWLQVIPTTAAVLTAVGALITLYAAISREWKRAPQGHSETSTAAGYFTSHGSLWHAHRTRKGWC